MAKNKTHRSLVQVGATQQVTEERHADKFQEAKFSTTKEVRKTNASTRNFPQVSFTISPHDEKLLNELAIYASNKQGKITKPSSVIRALIKFGSERKEDIDFE